MKRRVIRDQVAPEPAENEGENGLSDDGKKNLQAFTESSSPVTFKILSLALSLRVAANLFMFDYLTKSAEFTTPWNSFSRLEEAVHVSSEYDISAYKGDGFHMMPMLLQLLGPLTRIPALYHGLVMSVDVASAVLLRQAARKYLIRKETERQISLKDVDQYSDLAYFMYLFNPMSIGSAAIASLSTISNFGVIFFVHCLLFRKVYAGAIVAVILVFIYPYYIVLLAPLLVAARSKKLVTMSVVFSTTGALFAVNCLMERATNWIPNVFYFFWSIQDLTPNVGFFWYVFVFVFDQYRQFFTWIFQLTAVFPVIPLAVTVKNDPILLTFGALAHSTILSSYPSYAEAAVIIAMYPMFAHLYKYSKFTLFAFGALLASFVLTPIMWRMWMITGSGNANFYFAIIVVYNAALIMMTTDVFYSNCRLEIVETCAEQGVEDPENVVNFSVSRICAFIRDPAKFVPCLDPLAFH